MKEQVIVTNPYNKEHVKLIEEYENENNVEKRTSEYLKKITDMMSEADYNQLEKERPEITKTIFFQQNGKILTIAHLMGEKDRKVCQVMIDNTTNPKWQEKLLEEIENYAFTNLGMEEVVLMQEEDSHIPDSYFARHNFENLGIESGMQVYMKSKNIEKLTTYQI